MLLTYRYRLKDSSTATRDALRKQASSVNYVWNFCCQIQREAERRWKAGCSREASRWPTHFGLEALTAGCTQELGLHADTIGAVCRLFVVARNKLRHCPAWRSAKRNLDWIPIDHASADIRLGGGTIRFRKREYKLWWSRDLPADAKIKTAAFSCDARGRWYVNITLETDVMRPAGVGAIGIDLGLKSLAVCSDGEVIPNLRHVARYAVQLATAQRAGNKRRAAAIHAKIVNARRDHLHKVSTRLMRSNQCIVVGNVSASALAKTRMAKSVLDAGWSSFRTMLRYKAIAHGVDYREVDEAYTSQVCSECGSLPASRPKGIADLGIRSWECSECGAFHDRDHNAARNILRAGLARQPLAEEIAA